MSTAESNSNGTIAYRQLLDTVGSFVYTTDLQGRYTYANQLVLNLLGNGLTLDDVLGKMFTDFVDIGEDDTLRETDWRVIRNGETIAREEDNYIHATGETHTYWSIKKPLRNESGAIVGLIGISHDITEKKRLENKVRQQNELLDAVLNNIEAVVYMKDANRRFIYANKHMANLFGKSVDEIVGRLDSELMPQDVADAFWEKDIQIFATGQRYAGEESLVDAEGRMHHYWSIVVPWSGFNGIHANVGLITDITELHALKEKLQHQALTDSLTGIANRRSFFEHAEQEFARSRRHGHALALVALDIDHFKQINDRYGHPVGDSVLQHFAACCQKQLREGDFFARTGGEEFCILLPETNIHAALEIAERMREVTSCHCLETMQPSLHISASFGVTCLNEMDTGFDTLFSRADRALYAAKEKGRDQTVTLT
ncbi:MAG: sensor domain-containing diguanylate cyclase [Thermomonas sp.]|uniref:sensor domain-containing diguanylate cyclase n=1 Tax=Thermomonas sp. TaxID=1971895 RepID=UPI001EC2BF89|nr:sensor domain-containing diguanylate cyclase [Thermomonas sp.]MBV2209753.1 sensor domain-containing diguanylate cyclase [Thermomonas sp.]